MAEYIADFVEAHAFLHKPACAGVAEVVGGEILDAGAAAGSGESGLDGGDGVDAGGVGPAGAAGGEGLGGGGVQGDGAAALGFGVLGVEADRVALEVDAIPGEAEDFAGTHAGIEADADEVGDGGAGGVDEAGGFGFGDPADAAFGFAELGAAGGVGELGAVASVVFGDGGAEQGEVALDGAVADLGAAGVKVGVDVVQVEGRGGEAGEVASQGAGNGAVAGVIPPALQVFGEYLAEGYAAGGSLAVGVGLGAERLLLCLGVRIGGCARRRSNASSGGVGVADPPVGAVFLTVGHEAIINASSASGAMRMTPLRLKAGSWPVLTQTWTVRGLTSRRSATSLTLSILSDLFF